MNAQQLKSELVKTFQRSFPNLNQRFLDRQAG
jgi:hypothetical protein